MGDELHGVCFLEDTGDDSYTQRHDLNTCFHSRREADTYITATLDTFRND